MEKLFTTKETAEILHINIQTLRSKCRLGQIGFKKTGRKYLFSEQNIKNFLDNYGGYNVN